MGKQASHTLLDNTPKIPQIYLACLALVVGLVAGFGAVVFRDMIGLVHNLAFMGKFSFQYDANFHTPNVLGPWVILVPVVGAVIVAWLVGNFAPEAKGHGVPEVMGAIYHGKGRIRARVAVIKSLASSISIGTGGSVGREGPIVQIGSAFGSVLGFLVAMPARQRNVLVAAGAAGGVAATFDTPIGALAFAMELMLVSVSAETLVPVVVSVVIATYIGRVFWGVFPAFNITALTIPDTRLMQPWILFSFVPFGILLGFLSLITVKGIYWFEDVFERIPGNYYTRHMLGMFLVGLMIYGFMYMTGHYYIQGVGYATINDILQSVLTHPSLLLLLCGAKLIATGLTLGSGASGGVFSPSIFIGATFGGMFGLVLQKVFPGLGYSPVAFAIAGMAGMIGGATGAVLTAVTMVLEMTADVSVVLPVIISTALAYGIRKYYCNESIYTLKLLRRGELLPEGLQAAVAQAQRPSNVMNTEFVVLDKQAVEADRALLLAPDKKLRIFISDHDKIIGFIGTHATEKLASAELDTLIRTNVTTVQQHTDIPSMLRAMDGDNTRTLIVSKRFGSLRQQDMVGFIGRQELIDAFAHSTWLLV